MDLFGPVFDAIKEDNYEKFITSLNRLSDDDLVLKIAISASHQGRIDMLRELKRRGQRWNATIAEMAAKGGHLSTLQWLRENSCPWNASTTDQAAYSGKSECMIWAIENGCPISPYIIMWAKDGRSSIECIDYLHDNNLPTRWSCPVCEICIRKKVDIINELACKEGNYLTWLSYDLIESMSE